MHIRIVALVLLSLYFTSMGLFAQEEIRFERITSQQGLSQNTVNCILQDRDGMLWVGTMDGLNKYNGTDFELYVNDANNPYSLKNNAITALYEDSQGTLWIGTRKGLHAFDRATERFTCYVDSSLNPNYNRVIAIVEDTNQNLWLGYEGNGLGKLSLKTKKMTSYAPIFSNTIQALRFDNKSNSLWIGTNTPNLLSFDIRKEKFIAYPYSDKPQGDDALFCIANDGKGKLWLGTHASGLLIFDLQTKQFSPFEAKELNGYAITAIYHEKNGTVWIATQGNGLLKYQRAQRTFSKYIFDPTDQKSLSNNDVNIIFKDISGMFWFGTYNGGINKYDPTKNRFKHYKKEANNTNSLSANGMRGIMEDSKGRLWVGTTLGGLNLIDRAKNQFMLFSTSQPNTLIDDRINMIAEDRNGNIWVAMLNKGLCRITVTPDSRTGKETYTFKTYTNKEGDVNSLPHNGVLGLLYDKDAHILWVGTQKGLSKFDLEKQKFENYFSNAANPDSLSSPVVKFMAQDTDENILWLATDGGLNKFDKKAKTFKRYLQSNDPTSIASNALNALLIDRDGTLWVGTVGGGLDRFDKQMESFVHFTEKEDGLPNNVIYGILEDEAGYLWISTNKGIAKFDRNANDFYNYHEEDGLQDDEFNIFAFGKSPRTGEMFFGGINGFNSFFPNQIQLNDFQPNIIFTDFKIFNKSIKDYENSPLKQSIAIAKEIILSYKDNVFSFDFASLDYKNPSKVKYKYMMEGFDREWIETNYKRRTATYTNLPEGDYVFRVKATNSDGIWSKNEASLKITLTPPFWKLLIFKIFVVSSCLGILFFWYRQRIKSVESKREQLEKLVSLRTAEISRQNEEINVQKNELEKLYTDIKTLAIIGQEITSTLAINKIVMTVYEHINQLMDASGFGIGVFVRDKNQLEFTNFMENASPLETFYHRLDDSQRFSVWCFINRRELFLNDAEKDYTQYISQRTAPIMGKVAQSIIYLPLFAENQPIGVLTVQSFQKNAYTEQHLTLLRNLASYVAIAIDNADNYRHLELIKKTIENKNRYTTDSIRYAKTIQEAILPDQEVMENAFGEGNYFVIYQAKDIVSGDFYWCRCFENRIYFAVIDCTGHGVPGALMSMIGNTLLTDIITEHTDFSPAQILEAIHHNVRSALKQKGNNNDDGMDIALCMIEKNEQHQKITFAGAHLSLWYIADGKLQRLRGNIHSVGGRHKDTYHFTDFEINANSGDMIYLSTDGFTDQNNIDRIKYGSKQFQEDLLAIADSPIQSQDEFLRAALAKQLQNTDQRDDITVVGIRL
jgi:ligand-binding sensor domain-containing protein/serine phosphatase RsbU (regulator of sigma subunit)